MEKAQKERKEGQSPLRKRYAKSILLLCMAALLLTVCVNLFVESLPASYTRFDTTDIELYTISDLTRQLLGGLEEQVELYTVAQHGKEDAVVQELLAHYAAMSPFVRVEQIDPVLQPNELLHYGTAIEAGSVIVASDERFRILKPSELYVEERSYVGTAGEGGYVQNTYFAGEQQLSGAIAFVISDDLPEMAVLTGHGEAELPTYVTRALETENIAHAPLALATAGAVPKSTDLLLIYAPERDISETEAQLLIAYLQEGGKMIVVGSPLLQQSPNLESVAAHYGMGMIEGVVVENDSNYYLDQYPTYVLANVGSHAVTQAIASQGYFVLSPMSRGLAPIEGARESIQSTALLYTTDRAVSISAEEGESSEILAQGPFAIGLAIEEALADELSTRIVWISSPYLLLDDVNALSSGANSDLFLNALNWLHGFDQGISIRSKSLMVEYLSLRAQTGTMLGALIIGVVPLAVVGAGCLVLRRRRRR